MERSDADIITNSASNEHNQKQKDATTFITVISPIGPAGGARRKARRVWRKMKRGKGRRKVCEGGRLGRNEGRKRGTAVMQEYGVGGEAGREKCRYVCYGEK